MAWLAQTYTWPGFDHRPDTIFMTPYISTVFLNLFFNCISHVYFLTVFLRLRYHLHDSVTTRLHLVEAGILTHGLIINWSAYQRHDIAVNALIILSYQSICPQGPQWQKWLILPSLLGPLNKI